MRFATIVFAALAAGPLAALAAPAPAPAPEDNAVNAAQSCPSGSKINCGCTRQSGGGDGASCWDNNLGGPRHIVCPGKA
ncbi:hypothetical protein AbraIFM66950_009003 [Aspergillus brasiliensis]|nr:hypothetical protein AbraIFM66950_009003 [Aspergillus brasiliensis]